MTNIKLLDLTDLESITALLAAQETYFGVKVSELPFELSSQMAMLSLTNLYLRDDNPYFRSYGWVDAEGKLSAIINADFMRDQPFWIIRRVVAAEALKGTSLPMMHAIMSEVLLYAEARGYMQHLNLVPAKYKDAHTRIWAKHELRKDRYDVVEIENVKANEHSKFRLFWELLYGRIKYPVDTVVKMSVLRREHRAP